MQVKQSRVQCPVVIMTSAVLLTGSLSLAQTTSPFSTAVQALSGLDNYAQYDASGVSLTHFSSFPGYLSTVGGGIMNPSGVGFTQMGWGTVPNVATSAEGVPLAGISGDINLASNNRPAPIPNGGPAGQIYTSVGFRAQPDPPAPDEPQNETTPFYAGAWVRSFANDHVGQSDNYNNDGDVNDVSPNQVILSRRPFSGNGMGEGIDNIPGQDGWHLFMRDDDGLYGGTGKLTWQMNDLTGNLINFESSADLFADDWWHFVAFSYNGDPTDPNALSLYVDGSPVATTRTVTGSDAAMFITSTAGGWLFTVGNSPAKDNIWDGPIDETFIGWGELSASDVADLWTAAAIPAAPVLVPGDADGDGDVDLDDFDILTTNYGQGGMFGGNSVGDFDNNGVVNFNDFIIQAQNMPFGGPDESVSSLPEPATLTLVCLGALSVMRRRAH